MTSALRASIVDSLSDALAGLRPAARGARRRLVSRRALARRTALSRDVVEVLVSTGVIPSADWTVRESRWSDTGVAMIPIGPPAEPARMIIKFAGPGRNLEGLRSQQDRLRRLHSDSRLAEWTGIVPQVIKTGTIGSVPYFIETALPGVPATRLIGDARSRDAFLPIAGEVIAELHTRTAVPARVDDATLERWVEVPVRAIAAALAPHHRMGRETRGTLEDVRRELRSAFVDRDVLVGWMHGDYWPGNVLVDPNGRRITGIVDWDLSSDRQLAIHDPLHFILLTRRLASGHEFGDVVRGLLAGDSLEPPERSALAAAGLQPAAWHRDARESLTMAWLRYVGAFMAVPGHGTNPRWVRGNVLTVLDQLQHRRPNGGER